MNNKLFVGGLSRDITEGALREAFMQAGTVSSVWVKIDRDTGMPAGFGFVEMSNDTEAQNAITMWNDKELEGRSLTVNIARPREDRPRQGSDRNRGGYQQRGGGGRRY